MKFDASKIRKILVISLSNVGDVILTCPVIDILKEKFSSCPLSIVVGPRAKDLFAGNPHFANVYIYNKRDPLPKQFAWLKQLRKEHFDLVVDLRNTAIPFLLGARYKTPLALNTPKTIHMKQKHLNRLKTVFDFPRESQTCFCLSVDHKKENGIDQLLQPFLEQGEAFVAVAPGAANHIKRWKEEGFVEVCNFLTKNDRGKIVLVGDEKDAEIAERIMKDVKNKSAVFNACGKTNLLQLAALLERATLVIANDSGVMHMASYLDVPVLAIFGPTNPVQYAPWSSKSHVVKSAAFCTACQKPQCRYAHECMDFLQTEDVIKEVEKITREIKADPIKQRL